METLDEKSKMKSLQKSLKVLECFSSRGVQELGVSEIARMLNLNKSNIHNILCTLEASGYICQNKLTEKYSLGFKFLEFSYSIMAAYPYTGFIVPIIKDLASDLNLITYFGIPHGNSVIYLFSAYPKSYGRNVPYRSILGETAPYYCTSIGKAMLFNMSEEEILEKISGEKIKYTENTIVDNDSLLEDLRISKVRGYAVDNVEHENLVRCVGVPVTDRNGVLIGALSASGPTSVIREEDVEAISQKVLTAAFEISSRI